ncbi:MFS transporter [Streptomyces sp. NPDC052052]|uniref:MFS transporter n=1 Tax=Streptomyces sp. NPDC052052 TaxID=3154756 RepID=UPI00341596DA
MTTGGHKPNRWIRRHFHGVGYILIVLLVGANMPSPLYGAYREAFGFSPVMQTVIFAVYAAALVPALLVFGPLSDAIGRRPVLSLALLFGVLGATLMACADSTSWLMAGRIAQGLSVGTCSAAGAAALAEHEPDGDHTKAATAATATTAVGAALGPLFAGALAQYLPHGFVLPYLVFLCTLVPALVAVALLPASRGHGRGTRPKIRISLPRVPHTIRAPFTIAVSTSAVSWAVVGLFQAVVPSWITEMTGTGNLVVGGSAAALTMVCSAATQLSVRRLPPRLGQRLGLVLLAVGMLILLLANLLHSLPLLFVTTAVTGVGHGLAFSGGMQQVNGVLVTEAPEVRGSVLAALYTIVYAGLGVPVIAVGLLITLQGMDAAVVEFSLAAVAACVVIMIAQRRAARRTLSASRVIAGSPMADRPGTVAASSAGDIAPQGAGPDARRDPIG